MEREILLSCSSEVATEPYSEPDEFNPHPQNLFPKIHFNIDLSYTSSSFELSLPFRLWNQTSVHIYHCPLAC
jgi:hypothetical protein